MPVRKKTLGEQLADLANPAPSKSFLDDFEAPTRLAEDSSEGEEDDERAREHYVDVGQSQLRTKAESAIRVDEEKYRGRRVSRVALQDEDDVRNGIEIDDNDEPDEDDEEDISDLGEEEEYLDEEDLDGSDVRDDVAMNSASENGDYQGDFGSGDEDDDVSDRSEQDGDIQDQLEQQAKQEQILLKKAHTSSLSDAEKGLHVRNQMTLWDSLVETRIRLRRSLQVANQLPQPKTFQLYSPSSAPALTSLHSALQSLLSSLTDLRKELPPPISFETRKRPREDDQDVDETWTQLDDLDVGFESFRWSAIDKWSAKVGRGAGAGAGDKKFKAVDVGVSEQIRRVMSDRDRILKRTRLRRGDYKVLGKKEEGGDGDFVGGAVDARLADYDNEIFDDTDFYEQLLKEFIDSRMTDVDDPLAISMKWAQLRRAQKRRKKKHGVEVDTKASKGRKVRYDVHEKLANFMAPIPKGNWHEEMIEELFSGLFKDATEETGGRSGWVANDGLRIFG
ncbi:apoptosis-antagonizing transcription factor [Cladochytrium replicatum]|nr:apoptosis-antagonizing transcription factor [Cladochytrium replicatum]